MSNVLPLSSTRVTNAMTRDRITRQVQRDQNALFKLQQQLSTGLRIFTPSDDASAAQRAMALQKTIERKEQSVVNLQGANAALVSTEAALADVGTQLAALRSEALGVIDTISTDEQRAAVINTIDRLLLDLQRVGNTTFTQTQVLGGAEIANQPYRPAAGFVEYHGDESTPQTFVDLGYLFDSGASGDEVLGGFSEAIRGFVDLNPRVTPETRLSQLNGGIGVSPGGSITLTFDPATAGEPTAIVTIDLSNAETIEDVGRLIEAGAPSGSEVVVQLRGNGLHIASDLGTVGVSEVANGVTARELGILSPTPIAEINGTDLNPTLVKTDLLSDLVGAKAQGRIVSPGPNNDLVITANTNGASFNGLTVDYVSGAAVGAEVATYDSLSNTLTVQIAPGESTAAEVAAAINATTPFTAAPDTRDQISTATTGAGTVDVGASLGVGVTGGSDGSLDLTSGLRVTNGPETYQIDTSAAVTVEDLLNLLNRPEYGLSATINAAGDGIDVRTRRSGADFTIGENGGTTATDLGIRTYTADTRLSGFNRGVGVIEPATTAAELATRNTLRIEVLDNGVPSTLDVDVTQAQTVQDVLDAINSLPGGLVVASLATVGNGIVLTQQNVDPAAPATGSIVIGDAPGDTLTITANTPGAAGNRPFTLEVADSGSGGLTVNVTDDAITVDLGGTTPDTATIAMAIELGVPGYTVTTAAPVTVSTTSGPASFAATGGFDADQITISGEVAQRLGFFGEDEDSATSTTGSVASDDRNTYEVDSVFNTLLRMREALENGDSEQLSDELVRLDEDAERVNFGRAEIGVRLRTLEDIGNRLADEEVELRAALSLEVDADLVEVISDLTAQQASLEASLRVSSTLLSISILDFI